MYKFLTKAEIQCHGQNCCGGDAIVHPLFVSKFARTRWYGGNKPICFSRIYSCPEHNYRIQFSVGRQDNAIACTSLHVFSMAGDIIRYGDYSLVGVSDEEFKKNARIIAGLFMETGWYVIIEPKLHHIHADIRLDVPEILDTRGKAYAADWRETNGFWIR